MAIKSFNAVNTDVRKLKIICEMTKVRDAKGDKQVAVADSKIAGYMNQLGPISSRLGLPATTSTLPHLTAKHSMPPSS
jgi:hypothetical protein